MKKILIAVHSVQMAQQLHEQLGQMYCVIVCHNGVDAIEILQEHNPEVLVLDIRLSGMDGVTLLQIARHNGIHAQVIALADCLSDYILRALEQLEVSCLLRYDCSVSCIAARAMELVQQDCQDTPQMQFQRILALLGFRMNTVGCRITEQALCSYAENPSVHITTGLYPRVAKLCGGSVSQVEKAVRSSIESAWKNGDPQIWRMYFSTGKNGKAEKPSNGEFFARISRCVMQECNEQKRKNA